MSDIHILAGNGVDQWTVICHYPIPDVDNQVGVNYRTALVNSHLGGISQMDEGTGPGQITAAELGQIVAGELFEYSFSCYAESGATSNAQLLANVRAEYNAKLTRLTTNLQRRLKYYGWSGAAT